MSERIKACFDEAPEPSDDLRRRVRQLSVRKRKTPVPMRLKIFTGIATAVVLCGVFATRSGLYKPQAFQRPASPVSVVAVPTFQVGERRFQVWDYHWSKQGELSLIYTAGKLPADAWVTSADGRTQYADSSVTTQDWGVQAHPEGVALQTTVHLPMHQPADLAPGQVPVERISSTTGYKFEAVTFRFAEPSRAHLPAVRLTFSAPPRNYHGSELLEYVKNTKASQSRAWESKSGLLPRSLEQDQKSPGERIPKSWARQYGVNVDEATRQLEELDRRL